jgi:hypothetical protein
MVHLESDAEREEMESLLEHVVQTSPVRDITARGVPVDIQFAD